MPVSHSVKKATGLVDPPRGSVLSSKERVEEKKKMTFLFSAASPGRLSNLVEIARG